MERGKGREGQLEWLLDFMFQLYVDGRMYEYVKRSCSTLGKGRTKRPQCTQPIIFEIVLGKKTIQMYPIHFYSNVDHNIYANSNEQCQL